MIEFEILEKIKQYNRIIIHRHIRPDGDCIGSQSGLKLAIKLNYPEKEVYAVGDIIPEYCTPYGILDNVEDDMYKDALVIVVDTATDSRICDQRYKTGAYIIKIDHHDDSSEYGNINYVLPEIPACAAIITKLLNMWNFEINDKIASSLFFGIVTDTGRFRYRGINEEIFIQAGKLLSHGIDTESLYTNLYLKEDLIYKLQGYVYLNFKRTENGVAYIHFTEKLIKKFNVTKEDAANLVNCLDSIKGSLIWVVFVDQMLEPDPNCTNKLERPENEIRVRLRSRFVEVNDVAKNYRGGGHLTAAGATIYSTKEKNKLLKELDENLQKMEQKLRAEEERLMQQVDTQCLPSNLQEDEVLNSEKQVEQTKLSETERQVEQEKTLESDIKTRKKVEPQEKHKKCYPKKRRTLYFQKRIE